MGQKGGEVKSGKKGLWAILKESMHKSSSGCGPGCSCNVDKKSDDNQRKSMPGKP